MAATVAPAPSTPVASKRGGDFHTPDSVRKQRVDGLPCELLSARTVPVPVVSSGVGHRAAAGSDGVGLPCARPLSSSDPLTLESMSALMNTMFGSWGGQFKSEIAATVEQRVGDLTGQVSRRLDEIPLQLDAFRAEWRTEIADSKSRLHETETKVDDLAKQLRDFQLRSDQESSALKSYVDSKLAQSSSRAAASAGPAQPAGAPFDPWSRFVPGTAGLPVRRGVDLPAQDDVPRYLTIQGWSPYTPNLADRQSITSDECSRVWASCVALLSPDMRAKLGRVETGAIRNWRLTVFFQEGLTRSTKWDICNALNESLKSSRVTVCGKELYARLEQEQWRVERNSLLNSALRSVEELKPECAPVVDFRKAGYLYAKHPSERLLAVFSRKTGDLSWFDKQLEAVGLDKDEVLHQLAVHSGA